MDKQFRQKRRTLRVGLMRELAMLLRCRGFIPLFLAILIASTASLALSGAMPTQAAGNIVACTGPTDPMCATMPTGGTTRPPTTGSSGTTSGSNCLSLLGPFLCGGGSTPTTPQVQPGSPCVLLVGCSTSTTSNTNPFTTSNTNPFTGGGGCSVAIYNPSCSTGTAITLPVISTQPTTITGGVNCIAATHAATLAACPQGAPVVTASSSSSSSTTTSAPSQVPCPDGVNYAATYANCPPSQATSGASGGATAQSSTTNTGDTGAATAGATANPQASSGSSPTASTGNAVTPPVSLGTSPFAVSSVVASSTGSCLTQQDTFCTDSQKEEPTLTALSGGALPPDVRKTLADVVAGANTITDVRLNSSKRDALAMGSVLNLIAKDALVGAIGVGDADPVVVAAHAKVIAALIKQGTGNGGTYAPDPVALRTAARLIAVLAGSNSLNNAPAAPSRGGTEWPWQVLADGFTATTVSRWVDDGGTVVDMNAEKMALAQLSEGGLSQDLLSQLTTAPTPPTIGVLADGALGVATAYSTDHSAPVLAALLPTAARLRTVANDATRQDADQLAALLTERRLIALTIGIDSRGGVDLGDASP